MKKRGGQSIQTRSNGDQTREKIISAAEKLFGQHSFDAVSLRDITNAAEVTLALASYHFGTKENLFTEVIARRAHVLNNVRRERLAALVDRGGMTVEALIDTFMRPLFEQMQSDDDGWQAYVMLLAQLASNDRWLGHLRTYYDETANLFIAQLKLLLPNVPEENLVRGFSFVLMLMLQTVSKNRRVDTLSLGKFKGDDLDVSYQLLLRFSLAGLKALETA
ncbi:MAG TPA: TetR family transcriptional regulator [Ensifer sp.]|nr:TetR family transcriptional regulator [Ensifer sp.]